MDCVGPQADLLRLLAIYQLLKNSSRYRSVPLIVEQGIWIPWLEFALRSSLRPIAYGDVLPMVKSCVIWVICLQREGRSKVFYHISITIASNEFMSTLSLVQ